MSCYFVRYFERLRGFKFYDPSTRFFFEMGNAKFIEDVVSLEKDKTGYAVFTKN